MLSPYNGSAMGWSPLAAVRWLFAPPDGAPTRLISRWLFLRALGAIYFSAFFSLVFQIRGLIGPNGILPAGPYLQAVARALGHGQRLWYAPTVLWISTGPLMLNALCWVGLAASVLLVLNLWPRGMLAVCFVAFLSFIAAAQDFSSYQSDGMLLEAGFISLFFAPPGFRPGLGRTHRSGRGHCARGSGAGDRAGQHPVLADRSDGESGLQRDHGQPSDAAADTRTEFPR